MPVAAHVSMQNRCFELHHFEEMRTTTVIRIGRAPSGVMNRWHCHHMMWTVQDPVSK
jgi:hypothetical protein